MYVLETAYKAIAVCVMTLSVLLYITSPFWRDVVAAPYRYGSAYIPGLLTFFITFSNLSLLTMLAKLHRQPVVIALAALAGMALNVVLALLWMPAWSVNGAARAAGVGMFFGAGLVTLIYLLRTRTRLQDSTYFVLATPLLLLLPIRICGPAWAVVLLVAFFSPWVFTRRQKRTLAASAGGILRSWRRGS
jgi:O-antigen/teichoic acid export membrane protein